MNNDKDVIRRDRRQLEQALRDAGAEIKGTSVKCPFHEDKHASGSLYQGDDSAWRFKCQTATCGFGGDVFDVRERSTGRSVEEQLKELHADSQPVKTPPTPPKVYPTIQALAGWKGKIEGAYRYVHPETLLEELIVVRVLTPRGKEFVQCHPSPGGGFIAKAPPKPWPLYNRTRLALARKSGGTVVWVEGEKCVHALTAIGFTAVTSPGGSGNADHADYRPMNGVKKVILWPDHDPEKNGKRAGDVYAQAVIAQLQQLPDPPLIMLMDPAELCLEQDGSDVVDYLEEYGGDTIESKRIVIEAALAVARVVGGADDLCRRLDDVISGKRKTLAWPWREMSRLSKALLPGTITIVCGTPGSSKSLMLLELAWWMFKNGVRVAILELEDDHAYHLNRVLAQLDGNGDLTDTDWILKHPSETIAARDRHLPFLNSFAPVVSVSPDKPMTYRDVIAWMRAKAAAGAQLIAVDPVTLAEAGNEKPWIADLRFITEAKVIAREFAIPIIFVTHPKKGSIKSGPPCLDDLAGGAAFQRFAHCILWLSRLDKPKTVKIQSEHGPFTSEINRTVKLMKTRNGRGAGAEIGFVFEAASLRFAEQGIIVKEVKQEDTEDVPL